MKLFCLFLGILIAFGFIINELTLSLVYLMMPDGSTVVFSSETLLYAIKLKMWMGTSASLTLIFAVGLFCKQYGPSFRWVVMPVIMLSGSVIYTALTMYKLHTWVASSGSYGYINAPIDIRSVPDVDTDRGTGRRGNFNSLVAAPRLVA